MGARNPRLLGKCGSGMRACFAIRPESIFFAKVLAGLGFERRNTETFEFHVRRRVRKRLAVFGNESLEEHHRRDPVRYPIANARGDNSAVRVGDQYDVSEVLADDLVNDVVNVRVEVYVRCEQMSFLAKPSESRCESSMPFGMQSIDDTLPGPAACPGAVNDHNIPRAGCLLTSDPTGCVLKPF